MLCRPAVLALLCCAACDSPIEPQPQPQPEARHVQITPDPMPGLLVGASFQLQATSLGQITLMWSSSDTMIAAVNPSGSVRGKSVGSAWIYAIAGEDPAVRDSVQVMVSMPLGGSPPTIFIGAIRDGSTGALVDSTAVRGFIDIAATLDAPSMMAQGIVRIVWNGEPVCAEPMDGRGRFTHRCVFDTRRFANGVAEIRAQAVSPNGTIFAISTARRLTLAN